MIALPIWMDAAVGIAVFIAFFLASRYNAYAVAATTPYVSKPVKEDGNSRTQMGIHLMGHFAPYAAKRAYVRSQCWLFIAFLGIFLITLQTHRADAKILVCIILVAVGGGAVHSYRKLQASLRQKSE